MGEGEKKRGLLSRLAFGGTVAAGAMIGAAGCEQPRQPPKTSTPTLDQATLDQEDYDRRKLDRDEERLAKEGSEAESRFSAADWADKHEMRQSRRRDTAVRSETENKDQGQTRGDEDGSVRNKRELRAMRQLERKQEMQSDLENQKAHRDGDDRGRG
jgi:hypothetical protein